MMKFYLNKSAKEIERIEKEYDFIPAETNSAAANKSLSNICVKTVKEIAAAKAGDKSTEGLEKKLKDYRDYAVENLKG